MTPPEVGEEFYRMVRKLSGEDDPFRKQKIRQSEVVEAFLPWLREAVATAPDPLLMAVRLSVAGNAVDPGSRWTPASRGPPRFPLLMAVRLSVAGNAVDPGSQGSFDLERSVTEAVGEEAGLGGYPALREG